MTGYAPPLEIATGGARLDRRLLVSGGLSVAAALTASPSLAHDASTDTASLAVSAGGFRYLVEAGSPFSGGVAALAGHALIRVRLRQPLPLEQGLDLVARHLAASHRPPSALAALELRAPAIMSRPDFMAFNQRYLAGLRSRGFVTGDAVPVARSDMVPQYDPPRTDVVAAFTYAVPKTQRGAGETIDLLLSGRPEYDGDHVVAPGDVSPAGMARKAGFVVDQLRRGVSALGGRWGDLTGAQVYMTQPLPLVMDVLNGAGLTRRGVSFFPASPPVVGFEGVPYEFEADVRSIEQELVI